MAEKDLIIKYLVNEIRFHDCIIVPNFGGFIGSYESAYFDKSKGKYFPPSKALIFNKAINNNDGLLASMIKDGEEISYLSAISIIENTIAFWQKTLDEGNRIELEDMGYIYKSKLGHVQFYQNKAINLYAGSFGLSAVTATGAGVVGILSPSVESPKALPKVVLPAIEKVPEVVVEKPVLKKAKAEPKTTRKVAIPVISLNKKEQIETEKAELVEEEIVHPASQRFRINKKYLVAASFIPFLFYSYWIPAKTDFLKTGKIQVSDFNPLVTPSKAQYLPRTTFLTEYESNDFIRMEDYLKTLPADTKTFSYPYAEDYYIPVKLEEGPHTNSIKEENTSNNSEVKEIKTEINSAPISKGGYHIIAGCFGEKANAEKLINQIKAKGYSAQILDYHKGLHRVTAQSFASKSEALSARKQMKSNGVSGWILKK